MAPRVRRHWEQEHGEEQRASYSHHPCLTSAEETSLLASTLSNKDEQLGEREPSCARRPPPETENNAAPGAFSQGMAQ